MSDLNVRLRKAFDSNDIGLMERFIGDGATVDLLDLDSGGSLLSIAAFEGNVPMVEFLRQQSANVNHTTYAGETPLFLALLECNFKVARTLLEAGADPNIAEKANGQTPLLIAVRCDSCDFQIVNILLKCGANVNQAQTQDGLNPLHIACRQGKIKTVKTLIDRGANVNCTTSFGEPPLFHVLNYSHFNKFNIVRLLLEAGADPNVEMNKDGDTLLKYAIMNCDFQMVYMALTWGADANKARTKDGVAPIHLASRQGHCRIVNLLIDKGAAVHAWSRWGTAMQIAINARHYDVIEEFIVRGVLEEVVITRKHTFPRKTRLVMESWAHTAVSNERACYAAFYYEPSESEPNQEPEPKIRRYTNPDSPISERIVKYLVHSQKTRRMLKLV
jgi:ankyrin repeat protein